MPPIVLVYRHISQTNLTICIDALHILYHIVRWIMSDIGSTLVVLSSEPFTRILKRHQLYMKCCKFWTTIGWDSRTMCSQFDMPNSFYIVFRRSIGARISHIPEANTLSTLMKHMYINTYKYLDLLESIVKYSCRICDFLFEDFIAWKHCWSVNIWF